MKSNDIAVIECVAAFRAELGRSRALFGFPAALVALVLGNTCRFLCTAISTELTLIHCATSTCPAVISRFG